MVRVSTREPHVRMPARKLGTQRGVVTVVEACPIAEKFVCEALETVVLPFISRYRLPHGLCCAYSRTLRPGTGADPYSQDGCGDGCFPEGYAAAGQEHARGVPQQGPRGQVPVQCTGAYEARSGPPNFRRGTRGAAPLAVPRRFWLFPSPRVSRALLLARDTTRA